MRAPPRVGQRFLPSLSARGHREEQKAVYTVTPLLQSTMVEKYGGKGLGHGFCSLAPVEDTEQATAVFPLLLPQPTQYSGFTTGTG